LPIKFDGGMFQIRLRANDGLVDNNLEAELMITIVLDNKPPKVSEICFPTL